MAKNKNGPPWYNDQVMTPNKGAPAEYSSPVVMDKTEIRWRALVAVKFCCIGKDTVIKHCQKVEEEPTTLWQIEE
ncbi:hypothetical protein [Mangrovibacterium lignilyticum]|uniref:hypothetical protein n=1 Tax=Mangrovibacterium lignilyticum TaxID=2668052 RepID=UPI0013D5359E|nr:hypothetical protein [Mangrovibacterium lignilyticum]